MTSIANLMLGIHAARSRIDSVQPCSSRQYAAVHTLPMTQGHQDPDECGVNFRQKCSFVTMKVSLWCTYIPTCHHGFQDCRKRSEPWHLRASSMLKFNSAGGVNDEGSTVMPGASRTIHLADMLVILESIQCIAVQNQRACSVLYLVFILGNYTSLWCYAEGQVQTLPDMHLTVLKDGSRPANSVTAPAK